jgi:hypothetical protein
LARGKWREERFHGTYRVEGDRLLVRCMPLDPAPPHPPSDGYLLTLKPAARKP